MELIPDFEVAKIPTMLLQHCAVNSSGAIAFTRLSWVVNGCSNDTMFTSCVANYIIARSLKEGKGSQGQGAHQEPKRSSWLSLRNQSSIIIHHHLSSPSIIIIHHYHPSSKSSSIYHLASPSIIIYHHPSSSIIIYIYHHHTLPAITIIMIHDHDPPSSTIIMIHHNP